MNKETQSQSTERQIGVIVGTLNGVKESVDRLIKQFDEHVAEHRRSWAWIFPTVISLATLIVLVLHYW